MLNQWYELFYDKGEETETIFHSEECSQLRILKNNIVRVMGVDKNKLHIDLWENPENPRIVSSID